MRHSNSMWTIRVLALLTAAAVGANAQARDLKTLTEKAKEVERTLENHQTTQLGPSPCAGGGVTLLGISSATPGTALGKLGNNHPLNESMRQLGAAYAEPLRERPQLMQQVERLDKKLEDEGRAVYWEKHELERLTVVAQEARAHSEAAPADDKHERERRYKRYLAAVEEQKRQAEKLKGAEEQRDATMKYRGQVTSQLADTESHLAGYHEQEDKYLEQARELVKRYGCT